MNKTESAFEPWVCMYGMKRFKASNCSGTVLMGIVRRAKARIGAVAERKVLSLDSFDSRFPRDSLKKMPVTAARRGKPGRK